MKLHLLLKSILIAILSMVPSCGPQKNVKAAQPRAAFLFDADKKSQLNAENIVAVVDNQYPIATHIDTNIALYEAKLDIPFLFGQQFNLEQNDTDDQKLIQYESNADQKLIMQFYQSEMERLGWQFVGSLESTESLLVFQKPNKMVVISIRENKKKNARSIVISSLADCRS